MSVPAEKTSPGKMPWAIQKGESRNPKGISAYKKETQEIVKRNELNVQLKDLCLAEAAAIIKRWAHFALTEDVKYAYQYGKDILDRGMGKAVIQATIETTNTNTEAPSLQRTYEDLERTIQIEEERLAMQKTIDTLKDEIAVLKGEKQAEVIVEVDEDD